MEGITLEEEKALQNQLREGMTPTCPRCSTRMRLFPVPTRRDVAYVRCRVVLVCDPCGLRIPMDRV